MDASQTSRRDFLKLTGTAAAAELLRPVLGTGNTAIPAARAPQASEATTADYTLRIAANPIEIAHNRIVSTITYNDHFPGPLLRFKEGQRAVVDAHNDTDTPEQLHWHGPFVPADVDGASEEGTPFIPAHGMRRIIFTPQPAGFASTTRIIALAGTCMPASTAARLARCTSNPNTSPAATTAKLFWS